MSFFIKEEAFISYLGHEFSDDTFDVGYAMISINIIQMTPIMTVIYYDGRKFAAAKYNRTLGIFSDGFELKKQDMDKVELGQKGMSYILKITLKETLQNGQPAVITSSLSKMTASNWHKRNLKELVALLD